ncbi:unnamed protein product [Dicrocoelium dendriticum]|nr:unnamed protein product [Dicrocoelium dendriticum]
MLANKSAVAEVIQATTRANEKREHRRASLGPLHERITSIAAARFHIPLTQAVESLLDPGCLEVVNTFIQCGQAATCLAIYPAHSKQKSVEY